MRRAAGIGGIALVLAGAFVLGLFLTRSADLGAGTSVSRRPFVVDRPPTLVQEVRDALERGYYRPVPDEVLAEPDVEGLLEALGDSNTDFLTAAEYDALKHRTAESYSGIGLTVEPARAGLLVTSALRGPAREAGIRRGDVIVRIDGRPAGELTFDQSVTLMKGATGTVVHLTVRRPDRGRLRFTVVREQVALPSLRSRILETRRGPVGYLRLLTFPESAAERLEAAAKALLAGGARALVLDLRDNPGGLLAQAVRTTSLFLEEGIVCTTDGLHQERQVYEVAGRAPFPAVPLVVLVDDGTASAAEIVAAALQEHDRAVVVGRRSYGKASVQSVRPLSGGTALKLTTATYLTPDGVDLAEEGVRPSVRAADDPLTRRDEGLRRAKRVLVRQLAA